MLQRLTVLIGDFHTNRALAGDYIHRRRAECKSGSRIRQVLGVQSRVVVIVSACDFGPAIADRVDLISAYSAHDDSRSDGFCAEMATPCALPADAVAPVDFCSSLSRAIVVSTASLKL